MGSVQAEDGEQHPIVVLNLSSSGAMIQAHEPPAEGVTYRLEFNVHRRKYTVPFKPVGWVQERDNYGWRGPFVDLTDDEAEALNRAVNAVIGVSTGSMRPWTEVAPAAASSPEATLVVGQTAAGHDIEIVGADVLAMGEDGLELYVRLMSELETM